MTTQICSTPSPDDDPQDNSQSESGASREEARNRKFAGATPSRAECLAAIAALPGLVAMRFLTPAQANSIRASYEAILQDHDRDRQGNAAQLADDDVVKLWKNQPDLIDLLHPFLTQDQLGLIMREARDDSRKA